MDIKLNGMNMYFTGMDMFINDVSYVPPTPDILFRLDPNLLYENDNTCGGINSENTIVTYGNYSQTTPTFVYSAYSNYDKYYWDATNEVQEPIEAPITMEDMNFNFGPNTTLNMWLNIKAPLQRKVADHNIYKDVPILVRTKSGNVAFFYSNGGNSGNNKNKVLTVGYKCPYYIDDAGSTFKYNFDNYQFVLGMPNTASHPGLNRRFIITDFAYTFNTWYLISLVSGGNSVKLFINGIATKIQETPINVVQNLRGNTYKGRLNIPMLYENIPTAPNYLNSTGDSQEGWFDYEIEYEQATTQINGYSTGALMISEPYSNIKKVKRVSCDTQAKNYNPNTDTGIIEIYSKAMTDTEIGDYWDNTSSNYL